MYDCDKVKPLVSGYLEGDIFPENKKFVEHHLSICPKCQAAIKRVKAICKNLRNLPYLTTSRNFEYELHQRIANLSNGSSLRFSIPVQNWRVPTFGFAAVLVVALFLWVFNFGNVNTNTSSDNVSNQSVTKPKLQPNTIPGSGVNTTVSQTDGTIADSLKKDRKSDLDKSGVRLVGEKE